MIIKEYAMKNFKINDTDDKQTILLKKYYLSHNEIDKQWKNNEELERQHNFNKKYNELKHMKKNSKTSIQELQVMTALNELLNE